jgi:peptidyl-dipeptidase A
MKNVKPGVILLIAATLFMGCQSKKETMKKELVDFIKKFDSAYIPLYRSSNIASWDASITGKPEDFKKSEDLQMKLVKLFADKESLKKLEEIRASGMITANSMFFTGTS